MKIDKFYYNKKKQKIYIKINMKILPISLLIFRAIFCEVAIPFLIKKNSMKIEVRLGEEDNYYQKGLHLSSLVETYVFPTTYFPESSSTSKEIESVVVVYNKSEIKSKIYEDILYLPNSQGKRDKISIPFSFVLLGIFKFEDHINDGFCLSYLVKNSQSLTHQLYENKKISKVSFALEPTGEENGFVHFGKLEKSLLDRYYLFSTCDSSEKYNEWSCSIKKFSYKFFTYGSSIYPSSDYVTFDTTKDAIVFPVSVMSLMMSEFKESKCEEINKRRRTYIRCPQEIVENFKIDFFLEKEEFSFGFDKMFRCRNKVCDSVFRADEHIGKDRFVLGLPFLLEYLTTFDYENSKISFYHLKEVPSEKKPNVKIYFILIILETCLMGSILLYRKMFSNGKY